MNFTNKKVSDAVLIIIINEERLDASCAPPFKKYFSEVVNKGFSKVVLDLSCVSFMDSSGLGALISCLKLMAAQGEIVIVGAQANVKGLFTLTRMDRLFTQYENIDEVLTAIA